MCNTERHCVLDVREGRGGKSQSDMGSVFRLLAAVQITICQCIHYWELWCPYVDSLTESYFRGGRMHPAPLSATDSQLERELVSS